MHSGQTDFSDYKIYKHTFPNNKVYIGITCKINPNHRWESGKGYQQNTRMFNAIQKYGWENITHEILYSRLTKEEAEQKEIELIAYYNSTNRNCGYNIELGGKHRGHITQEEKDRISKKLRGHMPWNKNKKLSDKHRENLSKSHIGKTREKSSNKKAVVQYDKHGNFINRYICIVDASEKTLINKSGIANCARGKAKTAGGFIWKFEKDVIQNKNIIQTEG